MEERTKIQSRGNFKLFELSVLMLKDPVTVLAIVDTQEDVGNLVG